MRRQIKLLIIVKSIDGGTGTFVLNFLKIKKLFKRNKLIVKTAVLEEPSYRDIGRINKNNFIFFRKKGFYPYNYRLSLKNILNFIEEFCWANNLISDFNPHVILGVDIHCNLLAQINKLTFFPKVKTILSTHIDLGETLSQKSTSSTNFALKKFVCFFYKRANELVCVSKNLAKDLQETFELNKKVLVVYNGSNFKREPNGKLSRAFKKGGIIITVARLVEQKDHTTLIKAFSLVLKELPNSKLWITSSGPLKNKLVKLTSNLKLSKNVKFLGWVRNIQPYIRKSDILVLSSKREGFGYVLIEAMSQGKPVISTDTPYGPSEILDNGKYGILVPVENKLAMKKAIVNLLADRKKYDYYAKKALVRSNFFSLDKMLKSYKKIIIKLIDA